MINKILEGFFLINTILVISLMFIVFLSLFGFFEFVNNQFLKKYTLILIFYFVQGNLANNRQNSLNKISKEKK